RPVAELASTTPGQGVVAIAQSVSPAVVKVTGVADGKASVNGSGVLFRNDGYLITNAHLVEGVTSVTVTLADGSTSEGQVIGTDDGTDIGVVKVNGTDTAVATLGSANDLQAGTPAIAIGSPSGSEGGPSVTVGVVSAIGRKVQSTKGVALHD